MSKQSSEEAIEIAGFKKKKAEEPEIKLPTSTGSYKKQKNSRKKKSTPASLTTLKPLIVGSQAMENL